MNKTNNKIIALGLSFSLSLGLFAISGCSSNKSSNNPPAETQDNLTVGKVQRTIKVGMTTSEVAEALGSPNIVTTDEQRREVWVYDKIASDVNYSKSKSGSSVFLILFAAGSEKSSGSSSSSQKTLTVIIKFDNNNRVRDFAYHTSKF